MESRLSGQDLGFDAPASTSDDDHITAPAAYLEHKSEDPATAAEGSDWANYQMDKLAVALDELDERSRSIITARWLNDQKKTLHQLADQFGVSAERIRQLENNALKKLQGMLAT